MWVKDGLKNKHRTPATQLTIDLHCNTCLNVRSHARAFALILPHKHMERIEAHRATGSIYLFCARESTMHESC